MAVRTRQGCPIVGIGASAGGLKALEGMFRGLPPDTGLAFVIVTHLPPGRESTLPEILGRYTAMPVEAAKHGAAARPNHVYVCPPDRILTLKGGALRLAVPVPELHRFPIDQFLVSLAEDSADHAIGILLSGGGSDGTLGIRAIKENGGLTIAQGHNSSGPIHSGMPDTAVAAGVVDLVVPAEDMGARLAQVARGFPALAGAAAAGRSGTKDGKTTKATQEISSILLSRVGHDFSGYKQKTFLRRVHRRMQVLQLANVDDYVTHLRADAEEATLLLRDLLIGVTSFFRDPAAFEALEKQVIPRLFEGTGANHIIRVWVPGCATGEEAYSIAILLREQQERQRAAPKVQIFATDIDEGAMQFGRLGRYQPATVANVSKQRLKRFFTSDEVSFTISKDLRDCCVFSVHNMLQDPPFSRIDLISCRNVLIYFGADFQSRALPLFHFALKPSGFLFLGTSENVSQNTDLFAAIDKKQRIYQRRDQVVTPLRFQLHARSGHPSFVAGRPQAPEMLANLRGQVEARIMDRFAPAHVVVSRDGDVLFYSVRTGKYLEPAPGLPNRQLLAMARKGLRLDLRAALREAAETRQPAERAHLSFEIDGRAQIVDLIVEPFGGSESDPLFLVVFRDLGEPVELGAADVARSAESDRTVDRMEQELRETRERLQLTIEEYETAVEELKSSNEELQSINEELQSTNEELETSKEEMQAINEELNTVNAELNSKVEELDRAHGDLRNVFESTQVPIVFLDRNLTVRTFTPAATAIFKLISSDQGRPLTDIVNNLADAGDFKRDIQTVFEHGAPIERRVGDSTGRTHYVMRILPYRKDKGVIDGALVIFVDVTRLVEHEAEQRRLLQELNTRVRGVLVDITRVTREAATEDRSASEFAEALLGRIRGMATCYEVLARANWGEVPLADILAGALDNYRAGDKDRVVIEGPPVAFKAAEVLPLALAIHDLATEAARYGALADPKGRLAVTWSVARNKPHNLRIEWQETGGPRKKTSRRQGISDELADSQLKITLHATVAISDGPRGLRARIDIPLEANRGAGNG